MAQTRSQMNFDADEDVKALFKQFQEKHNCSSRKLAFAKCVEMALNADAQNAGEISKLQVQVAELKQAAGVIDERKKETDKANSILLEEKERLTAQLEEQRQLTQSAEEKLDDAVRELEEARQNIDASQPETEQYITDACALLECEPALLVTTISKLIEKSVSTTLVQAPIPDNCILLADLTPFEKYVIESVIQFSGALNAKELLIDRFFMPYQYYGNCDFKIRRMKTDRLRLAKQKFSTPNNNNND